MSERPLDDPSLPPPGQRHGAGSASILPYLLNTLATRPQALPGDAGPLAVAALAPRLPPARPGP